MVNFSVVTNCDFCAKFTERKAIYIYIYYLQNEWPLVLYQGADRHEAKPTLYPDNITEHYTNFVMSLLKVNDHKYSKNNSKNKPS